MFLVLTLDVFLLQIEKLMQNSESEDGEEVWEDLPDKSNHVIEKQAINFDQQVN